MESFSVIVATIQEAKALKGLPFSISISGIGKENAYKKAKSLIEKGVSFLISSGMCTGLSAEIEVGSLIIPEIIISSDGEKMNIEYNKKLKQRLAYPYIFSGPLLETEKVIMDKAKKKELHRETGCIAADMESAAILRAANEERIPFICIRAVSDSMNMNVPEWLLNSIGDNGKILLAPLIKNIIINLCDLSDIIKLIAGFYKATASLRHIMRSVYPLLPF